MVKRGTKGTTGTKKNSAANKFIPPHGGYQDLLSYRKALIVYDATTHLCNCFLTKFDRTREQMIQGARSGKQNILERSETSGTSKETEIKLTNTARASLKEPLEDYRDFMRTRGIDEWQPDHRCALRLRQLSRKPGADYATFKKATEHSNPAICANAIAGLIKVTCYLPDRQIERLEQDFLKEGGLRERMTRARLAARSKQEQK